MNKRFLIGVVVAGLSTAACKKEENSTASPGTQPIGQAPAALQVKRGILVARALGAMGPLRNTNSLEALKCNHDRGFRWFEVDLALTEDGELICFHTGDEKLAELPAPPAKLALSQIEGKKYAGRFPIVQLETLLEETERLEDVVLVLDTGRWPVQMRKAVAAALGSDKAARHTRIVLQAYKGKELKPVTELAKQIGAGVMLNIDRMSASDQQVEELAKSHSLLAVVSDSKRFTPWLAQRLHSVNVPILVHTVNDHRDVATFTRAGADGFYTDRYVPYETMATNPATASSCDSSPETERNPWAERDLMQARQFRFRSCAKRRAGNVELNGCDERAAIYGAYLSVPPGNVVHVELEAEAGNAPASLWFELADKDAGQPLKARETLHLEAKTRKSWQYDVPAPRGSTALEARLGLASPKDKLSIHRFKISELERTPAAGPIPSPEQDAGE